MESLERYAKLFDEVYPNYGDVRYRGIQELIARYDAPDASDYVVSNEFAKAASFIEPLTAIKNYKSQVPYPEDVSRVVGCIIQIRTSAIDCGDVLGIVQQSVTTMLDLQGFQLPTISAILHFCHPTHFPIVDVNIEVACALLESRSAADFASIAVPSLPRPHKRPAAKIDHYRGFIRFLSKVVELQRGFYESADYRCVDKALMVLGVDRLREQVER
jgi:hypothetical protein